MCLFVATDIRNFGQNVFDDDDDNGLNLRTVLSVLAKQLLSHVPRKHLLLKERHHHLEEGEGEAVDPGVYLIQQQQLVLARPV